MKEAFREFRLAAPSLMRWWVVVSASVLPIGVLAGLSVGEATSWAVAFVPLGFAMIGGFWLHPLVDGVMPSRHRFAVGFGWMLLMFFPSVAATAVTYAVVSRLVGVSN